MINYPGLCPKDWWLKVDETLVTWRKQLKTESAISLSVICDPTSDFPVDGFESVARSQTCTTKTN
jgi:hypothetical protein